MYISCTHFLNTTETWRAREGRNEQPSHGRATPRMPKRARPPKGRARNELVYKSLFNFFFLFSTRVRKVDAEPICLPDSGAPLSSADRTAQAGIPIGDSTCPFPRRLEYVSAPAGVLLRRFTRDRLALFALRKDRKVVLVPPPR